MSLDDINNNSKNNTPPRIGRFFSKKPECSNPKNLVENLDYLSGTISVLGFYDIFKPETIYKLLDSPIMERKELSESMLSLMSIVYIYDDTVDMAENNAIEKIEKMTDAIEFGMKTANFVVSQFDYITDYHVKEGCKKVDTAYEYIKIFNSTIEECKQKYTDSVSPHLLEITNAIEDLSMKFNDTDPDFEAANKDIQKLIILIQTETEAIEANAEKNLKEFENKLKEEGDKCRKVMEGYYNEFVQLLQN